jgi:CheY-like chemotaxis protein
MFEGKILVVEDEMIVAKGLQRKLEKLGYTVTGMVSTGEEAINAARSTSPDLILMDIILKGDMDGIEAAQEIREQCNIPIIYLTAYADKEILKRARVTRPYGYIIKPYKKSELMANIEMALYKNKLDKEEMVDYEDVYRDVKLFIKDKDYNIKKIILGESISNSNQISVDIGLDKIYISVDAVNEGHNRVINEVLNNFAFKFIEAYGGNVVVYPKGNSICLELKKPLFDE